MEKNRNIVTKLPESTDEKEAQSWTDDFIMIDGWRVLCVGQLTRQKTTCTDRTQWPVMNAAQKINSVYIAQVPGDWIEVHLGIDGDCVQP